MKTAFTLFKGTGLPDAAVVVAIAAMPVLELRGAIPVGVWLGLPVPKVLSLRRILILLDLTN